MSSFHIPIENSTSSSFFFTDFPPSSHDVRSSRKILISYYLISLKGQREVLEGILEYVDIRKRAAIDRARASGLDVQEVLDSDEDEDY